MRRGPSSTRPTRARYRFAVIAALVAAGVFAAPNAASASGGDLQVSPDGITYADANTLPVYPESWRFVPGEVRTTSVWVRNTGSATGLLTLEMLNPTASDEILAASVSVSATPAGGPTTPVTITTGIANGACTVLGSDHALAPGETPRIDVRAAVAPTLEGAQGQLQSVDFVLGALLSDAAARSPQNVGERCAAVPAETAGAAPSVSALPHTGGSVPVVTIAIGAAGIAAGLIVFMSARRRRMPDDDSRERF